jgi:hypothetical protein
MVLRRQFAVLAVVALSAGCGSDIRSKQKVQEAILQRLQAHSGLDLNSLDVTTTSVSFDKNLAYASVAFHPKGDSNVNSGMLMKYTLENREGKWVVIHVGDARGHAMLGHASSADSLPPGHPPVDSMNRHAMPAPDSASGGRTQ